MASAGVTARADDLRDGSKQLADSISVTGAIGPATAKYVKTSLALAAQKRAEVVILHLDTPGGLASSMREIIADVLASPVPVVGFVAPAGAHAASAGTYILYATHIAAMAPGTNLGAATPVQISAPPMPSTEKGGDSDKGKDAMTAKVTNDAVAFIRSLAELRRRNADWAEQAVREAASLSAQAALDKGVIDIIARDDADLLSRIDGREIEIAGARRRLATGDLSIETLEPGWFNRLLSVVTDPNIALILVIVGLYGLVFEFSSPGAIAPGVVGGISLVLGLYALNMLPVDYTGLALMLLGIGFLTAEAFTPTVVLGVGGLIAFLLGATMLIDTDAPEFRLSWTVIGSVAALCVGLFTLTLGYVWRMRHQPARTGAASMLGQPAEVLDWAGEEGHVLAFGERWQARAAQALAPGNRVEVTGVDGLTLVVRSRSEVTARGGGSP
nr:nodulation protein NfeD [Microvirga terricola]